MRFCTLLMTLALLAITISNTNPVFRMIIGEMIFF